MITNNGDNMDIVEYLKNLYKLCETYIDIDNMNIITNYIDQIPADDLTRIKEYINQYVEFFNSSFINNNDENEAKLLVYNRILYLIDYKIYSNNRSRVKE